MICFWALGSSSGHGSEVSGNRVRHALGMNFGQVVVERLSANLVVTGHVPSQNILISVRCRQEFRQI